MLSWFSAITRAVAAGALAVVGGLVVWSVLPTALGWDSHVIVSGSMQPRIMPGDVVLAQPLGAQPLKPGYVVVFDDPSNPGRLLVHRVQSIAEDGAIVTRGDSNRIPDSQAVARDKIHGLARLRVPYVGLPVFWRTTGDQWHIVATALALLTACAFVARDGAHEDDTDDPADENDGADPEPSGELPPAATPTPA